MGEKENYLRVPITMPADMFEFLENQSLKAKLGGGKKLANTEIVRAAIRFIMETSLDLKGCRNEEDVLKAIKEMAF